MKKNRIDISAFVTFFKKIKADYQTDSLQFYIALNKFAEQCIKININFSYVLKVMQRFTFR